MKRAIGASEIRKGDRVLFEWDKPLAVTGEVGKTLVAQIDCQWPPLAERAWLLDRPTPAVTLPETPTLGWLAILDPSAGGTRGTELGIWESADEQGRSVSCGDWILQRERDVAADHVTAFTEATAVPTSALEELRAVGARCDATYPNYAKAIDTFLAAIEAQS